MNQSFFSAKPWLLPNQWAMGMSSPLRSQASTQARETSVQLRTLSGVASWVVGARAAEERMTATIESAS